MNQPIDTTKLDPPTLAKHLGNPEGEIGKAVTAGLNKTNANAYSIALQKLGAIEGDRILEIGFGNGREIPNVLSLARDVSYFGIDISETMVSEATGFNSEAVSQGRVTLKQGTSASIPAGDETFSKALTLNTIYFWPNPRDDLRELRRVLKRSGRLVIGMNSPKSATGPVFQHGFRHYDESEITEMLKTAGFASVTIDTINESVSRPSGLPWNRDFFIVSAE
jgi:SAM-dependent methyltransferase